MLQSTELLLEGSYLYFDNETNYAQENFKLIQVPDLAQFHMHAEILSRIETGEFLKIIVRYEMTNHFIPFLMHIEKSIGNKFVQESFRCDLHSQELYYTFQSASVKQELKKQHSSKHYLTSPAFSTSALWSLSKKMDPTGRTAITLVNSPNEWSYVGPPQDQIIYAEFITREMDDYKLNNTPLQAAHLCLYEHDSSATTGELPVNIYLSKHFSIPYQLVQGTSRIDIKSLKKHST